MLCSASYTSPVGEITLACDGDHLVGLWLRGQKYFSYPVAGEKMESRPRPVLDAARKWLDRYFAGDKPEIRELPIAPRGSAFRKAIWDILCEIPYGGLMSYGEIGKVVAKRLNRPGMSGQAVGGAVGHNPISIIIPCHRVVGADGSLTGYAGGVAVKAALLTFEGVDMSRLYVPRRDSAIGEMAVESDET